MKKSTHIISFILLTVAALFDVAVFASPANSPTIAESLGWKTGKAPKGQGCTLCGGYYSQPLSIADVPIPPPYKKTAVKITAKGPVIFRENGESVLQDDVVLRQPGRIIHADKAILYRDAKLGKITDIKLSGHVRVEEDGKLLVSDKADYDIKDNKLSMNNAAYRIAGKYELLTIDTPFNAWGTAKTIHRKANGQIDLTEATYSTCSPKDPAWIMKADTMQLDHDKGEGYARNVVIDFKKFPIFYTPYYSFPLNSARKSGFLMPKIGYENGIGQQGFRIGIPYYWNIAPNRDFVFTPTWYTQRGVQFNGLFRYLTANSNGDLYASILPNDRQFANYKTTTLNTVSNSSSPTAAPYITELQNSSNNRIFLNLQNDLQFNDQWSAKLYARYMSDSYYAEDFQTDFLTQNTNQIPSFGELNYQGLHWKNTLLIQTYETLHPLDQFNTPVQNQYTRLPELDFSAAYPQFIPNFNFNLSAQAVKFDYQSDFTPLTYQLPIGERLHFQPSISRPFTWSSFYITPQLTGDSTSYFSELPSTGPIALRPDFNANRTLPIFDIDSGLYFDRQTEIGGKSYIQTLQPRVFYLYTPYVNQNAYPNFDTLLLPFSTANLYSLNEFSGFDRLQNANQLSLGLSSNLLRSTDASDALSAQLGLIDYFTNPQVCLSQQDCSIVSQTISPITGNLTWNPNALWEINTQAAWDTALGEVNNAQMGAEYHFLDRHIVILNYQFAHGNSDIPFNAPGFTANSSLVTLGLVWPLAMRWDFFGYTYYDLTHGRPQNQYIGLSYNTCCWAMRFIVSDNYNGTTQINGSSAFQNKFSTSYFFQFSLKGLASTGYGNAESMLVSTLPGFADPFSNEGHYAYGDRI